MILAHKFKWNFTMCADNADNARDTTIIWDARTQKLENYDDDDVYEKLHHTATPHETRFESLREISNYGQDGIL